MSAAKRPRTSSPTGESTEAQPIHDNLAAIPPMELTKTDPNADYYFAEGMDPDGSRFTLLSKPSRYTGALISGSVGMDLDLKKAVTFVTMCDYETCFKRCLKSAVKRQYSFHNNAGATISTLHYSQISFEDPAQTTPDPATNRMLTALESITDLHSEQANALRSSLELQRIQAEALNRMVDVLTRHMDVFNADLEAQNKLADSMVTMAKRMTEMEKQTAKVLKIVKRNRYL